MMIKSNLFSLLLLIAISLLARRVGAQSDCPQSCTCSISSQRLTIACLAANTGLITLPNPQLTPSLQSITSLVVTGSNLTNIPNRLCSYAASLTSLDLSNNQIATGLNSTILACLTNLVTLNLANNKIPSLDVNTFNQLNNLVTLDLSYNSIVTIPTNTFVYKLNNLQTLSLQHNKIQSLDPWYFYMKSIRNVNLANNMIATLTNNIGFYIRSGTIYPILTSLDLSNNQIRQFDDSVLALYHLCDQSSVNFYIHFLYNMSLVGNPLNCDCSLSYALNSYMHVLIASNSINTRTTIFQATCQTASSPLYLSQSPIYFFNPFATSGCSPSTATSYICGAVTTTTTSGPTASSSSNSGPTQSSSSSSSSSSGGFTGTTPSPQLQIGLPDYELSVAQVDSSFYVGQILGIIIGFLGALILFLLLMYLICPIEVLACCFTIFPCFYGWCPCKSRARREKEYDLFISYNRNNEKWVKMHLVPFIKENYLVENYVLHYNDKNKNQVFSSTVKEIMSSSTCVLIVLSDSYLMHEWNNVEFRNHLCQLITSEGTRLVCVQLHDVSDEEVEEYFRHKIQIPSLITLEDDEFMFWQKLYYHLYMNDREKAVMPMTYAESPREIDTQSNDGIDFERHIIKRPIIHLDGCRDPFAVDHPKTKPPIPLTDRSDLYFVDKINKFNGGNLLVDEDSELDFQMTGLTNSSDNRRSLNLIDKSRKVEIERLTKQMEEENNVLVRKNSATVHVFMPQSKIVLTESFKAQFDESSETTSRNNETRTPRQLVTKTPSDFSLA